MEKTDFEKRMSNLRKFVGENGGSGDYKNPGEVAEEAKKADVKICPFSIAAGGFPCGEWCALYRKGKIKWACPLQEIPSISWNTRSKK